MTAVYALQFALPLVLIAWMVFAPGRSRLGFVAQCFGSAAALGALALHGVWLLPPWCAAGR